jgi:hypothetical protein
MSCALLDQRRYFRRGSTRGTEIVAGMKGVVNALH